MKPRINAARRLADEIARIGALDRQRSTGRASSEGAGAGAQSDLMNDIETSGSGALPVSPPNSLSGKLLRVVVSDPPAKEELCKLWH